MTKLTTLKPTLTTMRPTLQAPKDEAGRSRYRDANDPHRAWYKLARWQKLRQATLLRDGYQCQMCGAPLRKGRSDTSDSIMRPAVIDHQQPHKGDAVLFWADTNVWAVCCDCHDGPCQRIEMQPGISGREIRMAKLAHRNSRAAG